MLLPFFLLLSAVNPAAYAQDADHLATTAVELRGDEDTEELVDVDFVNSLDADIEAPAFKSDEEGERAAARYVKFSNYTPWFIQCYVNGVLQGTMAPWGDFTIYLPRSETYRFYAVAHFDDGSRKTWGALNRYVSGAFTWSLYP